MRLSKFLFVGGIGALALSIGCSRNPVSDALSDPVNQPLAAQETVATEQNQREKLIKQYETADLARKSRILADLYGERAVLVPVTFNENSDYTTIEDVSVRAGNQISIKDNKTDGEVELRNNLDINQYAVLKLPEGHSLLVIRGYDTSRVSKLINVLDKYSARNPRVGISTNEVSAIQSGLRNMGYIK